MPDRKVTALTPLTLATQDDLLLIIDDPNGTATGKKITVANFVSNLTYITASTSSIEALKMTVTANNSHTGNTVTAAAIRAQKQGNFTGDQQYGLVVESLLTVAGANVTGIHAAGRFNIDVGQSANSGNAYGIIIDSGKANSSWTRAVAPLAFIGIGESSNTTKPTQYLFDLGRAGQTVSANLTANAGNNGVVFTCASNTANTLQCSHKIAIQVNGTRFWIMVSNSA